MSITPTKDPLDLFRAWLSDAEKSEPNDPSAAALASVAPNGGPSIRMVLLRGLDERGFVFYTNLESRKGTELLATPKAALCFHWKSLRRQVRVEGTVSLVEDEQADTYFGGRDRGSQLGAWASRQSRPMSGKSELLKEVAKYTAKFATKKVSRPPHWSGFRVHHDAVEFWRDGKFRLHDRLLYDRIDGGWRTEVLFP